MTFHTITNDNVSLQAELTARIGKLGIPEDIVKYLAKKILHNYDTITLRLLVTQGFSSAIILLATGRSSNIRTLPYVMKIGQNKKIIEEHNNYKDFVVPYLSDAPPGTEETATQGEWAALVYREIGRKKTTTTFAKKYHEYHPEEILTLWYRLFNHTMQPWIETIEFIDISIWDKFYKISSNELNKIGNKIRCLDLSLNPDPVKCYEDFQEQEKNTGPIKTYTTIVHGDLNSCNILIEKGRNIPWLIDFAHTGRSHYLKDFAKLECEIKFILMDSDCDNDQELVADWLELDKALDDRWPFGKSAAHLINDSPDEVRKAFIVISGLRRFAKDRMVGPKLPQISQYRAALLYFTLKTIQFTDVSEAKKIYALRSAERLCLFKYSFDFS